ncbi:MAG: SDR family NAD(P)-dependent oxidoreductase [Deinococcota bacterium]
MSSGSLEGKRMLVTGATNGIGKYTALELARNGAIVLVHGRNPEKTYKTVDEIKRSSGNEYVEGVLADFSRLSDVHQLAGEVAAKGPLDGLINNAGIGSFEYELTVDGFELTFAVNHLAPFLLTNLLLGSLQAQTPGRIVTVSSQSHRMGKITFENPNLINKFDSNRAYAQSKLANLLFSLELSRRLKADSVTSNAFDPGPTRTGMMEDIMTKTGVVQRVLAGTLMRLIADHPAKVGSALAWVATAPELVGQSGGYFGKRKQHITPSKRARDVAMAGKLWELSAQMVKL